MKCPNCGAEITGNVKFCEFCGSQITFDMRKEQERLNKKGCPKCGSSNIAFNRETQGEIRRKNTTAVVRSTIGYCKDCGYTWTAAGNMEAPRKKRTWLWVLGWIFVFPVPLTILMLRPTCKLDKKIRYIIIVAAWILYGIWMLTSQNSDTADTSPAPETARSAIADVPTASPDTMEIEIEAKVNEETGAVLFGIKTNQPESTRFTVVVSNSSGYSQTDTATVLADGVGYTAEFSDNGSGLAGNYVVTVYDEDGKPLGSEPFVFGE